jgi:hypothetical protein
MEALRGFAPLFAPWTRKGAKLMLDVVFIFLGLGLIGAMAFYAQALTRA